MVKNLTIIELNDSNTGCMDNKTSLSNLFIVKRNDNIT